MIMMNNEQLSHILIKVCIFWTACVHQYLYSTADVEVLRYQWPCSV